MKFGIITLGLWFFPLIVFGQIRIEPEAITVDTEEPRPSYSFIVINDGPEEIGINWKLDFDLPEGMEFIMYDCNLGYEPGTFTNCDKDVPYFVPAGDTCKWSKIDFVIDTTKNYTDSSFLLKLNFFHYPDCEDALTSIDLRKINSTRVEDAKGHSVKVFPNPATHILNISSDIDFSEVIIYSLDGQEIINNPFTKEVDISFLKSGLYLIKLNAFDNTIARKFTKF